MEDITHFCGATDAPAFDFWWNRLCTSKSEWDTLVTLGWDIYLTCFLRFTSDVTPAIPIPISASRAQNQGLWSGCLTEWYQADVLPAKLSWLGSASMFNVCKRSCGKVMFLHLSVSHSVHGGVCLSACWDTHPPLADIPLGKHLPSADTPWEDTPQ